MAYQISIHALREEGDLRRYCKKTKREQISIHALREEGDFLVGRCSTDLHRISIHALREEGDRGRRVQPCGRVDFYPRPPRGGRLSIQNQDCQKGVFLSTPSARRATHPTSKHRPGHCNFYPRPPRGGRRRRCRETTDQRYFYPRPPRGGRLLVPVRYSSFLNFYPRPPRGGRPGFLLPCLRKPGHFYPRPPRGGRRNSMLGAIQDNIFLSTPSARRATRNGLASGLSLRNFYPRPPRGGRREIIKEKEAKPYFYPRPPRGGRP